jgi:hypothetical protein
MGPSAVALPTSYPSLLRTAGFVDIETTDLTAEFGPTLQRWTDATERNEAAVRAGVGDQTYDERAATRAQSLAALDEGLLSRFQYTATR